MIIFFMIALASLGLGVALFYSLKVSGIPLTQGIEPQEANKLGQISDAIAQGAMAFFETRIPLHAVFHHWFCCDHFYLD